jgi:hypothetical protein
LTELRAASPSAAEAVRRETMFVAWTALALGLVALAYCVRHRSLLLYGDAVAHLHIARRVFDSITPGFRQLGSVWLPLPHILLLPFVWNMGIAVWPEHAFPYPVMCWAVPGSTGWRACGWICLPQLWLWPSMV